MGRYSETQIENYAQQVIVDGYCVLPGHLPKDKLIQWREALLPLLAEHVNREGQLQNRGTARYYVTLPFTKPFSDPQMFDDDDIVKIVERLVGEDCVMCQLASDTPLIGSEYQDIHRDAPPLFPEWEQETPPFQLAVNFPLVDVTEENGPFEVARATHLLSKSEGLKKIESGEITLEPILMNLGDVMVRDVRGLHRGTPNRSEVPRPMVVIGYSRRWLLRPEVSIRVPREALTNLSRRAQSMLRFNLVVESLADDERTEVYQSFAY